MARESGRARLVPALLIGSEALPQLLRPEDAERADEDERAEGTGLTLLAQCCHALALVLECVLLSNKQQTALPCHSTPLHCCAAVSPDTSAPACIHFQKRDGLIAPLL